MTMPTVLVVDDDDAVRDALCFLLAVHGFDALGVPGGQQLLAVAPHHPQACILIDYSMPEMDGMQTLRALRDQGMQQPAIFMTGHAKEEIGAAGASLGAVATLSKPCDDAELVALIREALESDFRSASTDGDAR